MAFKDKLSQPTRLKIAFGILTFCTFGILFTGPDFNFALQVVLTFVLLIALFWLIT